MEKVWLKFQKITFNTIMKKIKNSNHWQKNVGWPSENKAPENKRKKKTLSLIIRYIKKNKWYFAIRMTPKNIIDF